MAQGGTFLNPAVHRAFEVLTGRRVICPDQAGLAGAWGAALHARDAAAESSASPRPLSSFVVPAVRRKRSARCHGCENRCPVTLVDFEAAGRHVAGNRCERIFHSGRGTADPGINHLAAELDLLLRRPLRPSDGPPRQRVGLPLALGTYENLPFWTSLLVRLGHEVVFSGVSDRTMVEEASRGFCSDSVCLPARIAGAHLVRLGSLGVDRVLFPMAVFEAGDAASAKRFNCPIVTGYPEVVASYVPAAVRERLPIATPPVSFADAKSAPAHGTPGDRCRGPRHGGLRRGVRGSVGGLPGVPAGAAGPRCAGRRTGARADAGRSPCSPAAPITSIPT